jgi:hypothetical protein
MSLVCNIGSQTHVFETRLYYFTTKAKGSGNEMSL